VDCGVNGDFYAAGDVKIRGEITISFVDLSGDFPGKEKKFFYGKRPYITFNYFYVCV
jgi:hypothetical protein